MSEEKTENVLTEIKVLNAGSSFGELALMENKPRAATIRCKEDCIFSVLDKRNFEIILSKKNCMEKFYIIRRINTTVALFYFLINIKISFKFGFSQFKIKTYFI